MAGLKLKVCTVDTELNFILFLALGVALVLIQSCLFSVAQVPSLLSLLHGFLKQITIRKKLLDHHHRSAHHPALQPVQQTHPAVPRPSLDDHQPAPPSTAHHHCCHSCQSILHLSCSNPSSPSSFSFSLPPPLHTLFTPHPPPRHPLPPRFVCRRL